MTGLRVDCDVAVPMRDGVELRADVYRPDDSEIHVGSNSNVSYPVLLHRTPYDKANPALTSVLIADPVALARAGYVVVVQDVRGRFASEGTMDFAAQEHDDGYDTVEWAADQPWCNGRVGIYGSSYHAIAVFAALAARPPHLGAAFAMTGTADLAATVRPGGLFELGFLTAYSLGQSLDSVRRSGRSEADKADLGGRVMRALARLGSTVEQLPISGIDVLEDSDLAPWWRDWTSDEAGTYVDPGRCLARGAELSDVPLLEVVGFMDFMAPSMWEVYARRVPSPRHRLVAGPWSHAGAYTGAVGARSYAAAAGAGVATWGPVITAWFDQHLTDRPPRPSLPFVERLVGGAPVTYFVTGSDRWLKASHWPPDATETTYALHSDGHANTLHGDGTLLLVSEDNQVPAGSPDHYVYDPAAPVPTCGGAFTQAALGPDGIQDQRGVEERADVLVYTSAVLTDPVAVVGAPVVVTFLSSSAEDTDVVVKLVDVEPDGFAANVSEGAIRARHRDGGTCAWLVPGEACELTVPMHPIAHTFRPGHCLRLDITSSSFPRFSRNLGTRVVPEEGTARDIVVAHQTVHHDGEHPSRLVLQVTTQVPSA